MTKNNNDNNDDKGLQQPSSSSSEKKGNRRMRQNHKQRKEKDDPGDGHGHGDHGADDDDVVIADPDGTLNVARGQKVQKLVVPNKSNINSNNSKISLVTHDRVEEHLQGTETTAALTKRRLQALKEDDANPIIKDARHGRALESRKKQRQASRKHNSALTATLQRHENKRWNAAVAAASAQILLGDQAGVLEPEHDMERTASMTQTQLVRHLLASGDDHDGDTNESSASSAAAAKHYYNLQLPGPYGMEYDRSGRYAILYGQQQGHLALMDCHYRSLQTEFHVHERVRDACFLHNFTLFAAAQSQHVFIYDHHGAEVHRLDDHVDPMALTFLPYHWLLASVGRAGWLKYQDTSTGSLVSTHRTQLGPCRVLRQNPSNAVLHAGHGNGTVTLWSPAQSRYLAKILCHKGAPIHSLALTMDGSTMVTGGADCQVKVWDLRMTFKPMFAYYTIGGLPSSLDISQRGILGIAHGSHATFWGAAALKTKEKEPYMHHLQAGHMIHTLQFRPFEDACGLGYSKGISSIIIPGSGEPNLDTSEYHTNPMQDAKQRREQEVRALLDKLSPHMIGLDPDQVGGVEESDPHKRLERIQDMQAQAEADKDNQGPTKKKGKKRGKSKIRTQLKRRKQNVVDHQTMKLREEREKEKAMQISSKNKAETAPPTSVKESAPDVLRRFF